MATYQFSTRQRAAFLVAVPVALLIAVPVALTSGSRRWLAFWLVAGVGTMFVLAVFVGAGLNFTTVTSSGVTTGKRYLRRRFYAWPDIIAIAKTPGSYRGTVVSGNVEITVRSGRKITRGALPQWVDAGSRLRRQLPRDRAQLGGTRTRCGHPPHRLARRHRGSVRPGSE